VEGTLPVQLAEDCCCLQKPLGLLLLAVLLEPQGMRQQLRPAAIQTPAVWAKQQQLLLLVCLQGRAVWTVTLLAAALVVLAAQPQVMQHSAAGPVIDVPVVIQQKRA
jgi:hypothetical protein